MSIISFIICSWQAPATLDGTLVSIQAQKNGGNEVILVNNGFSAEREKELLDKFQEMGLHIVREPQPGLGFARKRGFNAAKGEMFVLLDDDNTVDENFVETLMDILSRNSNVGGICPVVRPAWEKTPTPWLVEFGKSCLSYNTRDDETVTQREQLWSPDKAGAAPRPPGGGMIVHRKVAELYLASQSDDQRLKLGRTRNQLVGCEDADIYRFVKEANMCAVSSPALTVFHHIPKTRTRLSYLVRLNYQMMSSYGIFSRCLEQDGQVRRLAELRFFAGMTRLWVLKWVTMKIPTRLLICQMARQTGWMMGRLRRGASVVS